jgi:hypothetical protein
MVNHSGVHPNLRTVCRRIGYRVHLLLVATTDVNPNEEFFFDKKLVAVTPLPMSNVGFKVKPDQS